MARLRLPNSRTDVAAFAGKLGMNKTRTSDIGLSFAFQVPESCPHLKASLGRMPCLGM